MSEKGLRNGACFFYGLLGGGGVAGFYEAEAAIVVGLLSRCDAQLHRKSSASSEGHTLRRGGGGEGADPGTRRISFMTGTRARSAPRERSGLQVRRILWAGSDELQPKIDADNRQ